MRAATLYYDGVSALLNDRPEDAVRAAERIDCRRSQYAPVYDLLGAAHTKLGQHGGSAAGVRALARFDPHDSTAYTNLGLLALAEQKSRRRRPLLRRSALARAELARRARKAWHERNSAWSAQPAASQSSSRSSAAASDRLSPDVPRA